jgi:hypothetical protein
MQMRRMQKRTKRTRLTKRTMKALVAARWVVGLDVVCAKGVLLDLDGGQ